MICRQNNDWTNDVMCVKRKNSVILITENVKIISNLKFTKNNTCIRHFWFVEQDNFGLVDIHEIFMNR